MSQEVLTLGGVLHLLLRHKRRLILSGIVGACLAFVVGRMLPLYYAGEGSLIFQTGTNAPDGVGGTGVATGVQTQVNVLQAEGLIRDSVAALPSKAGLVPVARLPIEVQTFLSDIWDRLSVLWHLGDPPARQTESDKLVTYVKKHLTVEAKDASNVIGVRVTAGSPDVAATMANTIMQTYVATASASQRARRDNIDRWIAEQTEQKRRDVEAAERRVDSFMQQHHDLSEVQGSLTAAIQLSKDEAQLALAREELTRQQAALESARGGGSDAPDTLSSKSIQALKELESKTIDKIDTYTELDPRRATLQRSLNGTRAQIQKETALIVSSLARQVQIAQARVRALEAAVQRETDTAQRSTVAGSTLKQLMADLQAKQQLYVAFTTQAGQARLVQEQEPSARILFAAVPPVQPVQSYGLISLVFGLFGGMAAAAGSIVMRSAFGSRINTTYEMAMATELPVLGGLPDLSKSSGRLKAEAIPSVKETFRAMALTLQAPAGEGTSILFASADIGEGKTTVAAAFARRLSDDGYRVLLIDADLRRPQLARMLSLKPKAYLESVLNGTASFEEAIITDPVSNMSCLVANGSARNPAGALGSEQFKHILTVGKMTYDFVVLDGTPVLHVADSVLLAGLCDRVVFAVQAGRMSRDIVSEAISRFPARLREKMFSLMTRAQLKSLGPGGYYAGYTSLPDLRL